MRRKLADKHKSKKALVDQSSSSSSPISLSLQPIFMVECRRPCRPADNLTLVALIILSRYSIASGGGVINVARVIQDSQDADDTTYYLIPMLSRKANFRWSRDGTDIIDVSESDGGRMWETPWLNRDCLELGSSRSTTPNRQGSLKRTSKDSIAPSSLDRSTPSRYPFFMGARNCMCLPRSRGQDCGLEEGTKGPKYSVSTPQPELASSSTPASLPLLAYCLGLVFSWPLFVCDMPLSLSSAL
ncbi:hypothetical protein F5Y06DRAFT_196100 [Hypoxylon sp. FL0890]|nr:hypothetical protein F5Y06DRAFT_196100 [Hypoxylon sp. FL0890]